MRNNLHHSLLCENRVIEISEQPLHQQQQQQNQIEDVGERIMEERVVAINQLSSDVQQVSDLFTDMALLVHEQGHHIDNIETNIVNSRNNIEGANRQLVKASRYQRRKRKCVCRCICFLIIASTIGILILVIKVALQNHK